MPAKTHNTAVVLIPPEELCGPIQAIRRRYDRHVNRWMPHITLTYPFWPHGEFDTAAERLRHVCGGIRPFEVCLDEFRHFHHGRERYTLWLAPEPKDALVRLQAGVESAMPDCNDVSRRRGGFTPHLSVGQIRGQDAAARLEAKLQASWMPSAFSARRVSLIWRGDPPDDVFRVDRHVELGI